LREASTTVSVPQGETGYGQRATSVTPTALKQPERDPKPPTGTDDAKNVFPTGPRGNFTIMGTPKRV